MNRTLSLHHLSMLAARPSELVRAASAGGFDRCGLRLVDPDDGTFVGALVGDAAARRRLLATLADTGVAVLDVEAVWLRAGTDVPGLRPALVAAADLGARHVLTVGHDPVKGRLLETLGRFADLAAEHGLQVPLEFITYTAVPDLASAAALVRDTGRANVKVLVDSLQFFRAGADFAGLAAVEATDLPYAQISDAPLLAPTTAEGLRREARTDRLPPGEGELDLSRLLAALPPGLALAVEAPTRELAAFPYDRAARRLGSATRRLLARTTTTEDTP